MGYLVGPLEAVSRSDEAFQRHRESETEVCWPARTSLRGSGL